MGLLTFIAEKPQNTVDFKTSNIEVKTSNNNIRIAAAQYSTTQL